jgi:hypothetical protein
LQRAAKRGDTGLGRLIAFLGGGHQHADEPHSVLR